TSRASKGEVRAERRMGGVRRMASIMKRCAAVFAIGLGIGCASSDEGSGAFDNYVPTRRPPDNAPALEPPSTGSNVSFGGSQDIGFLRGQLEAGMVPTPDALDPAGFFAEHHIETPPPSCGERVCVQPMVGVMQSLSSDGTTAMLHVG